MKKLVLVLLAVLMTSASFAQFQYATKVDDMKNMKALAKGDVAGIWSKLTSNYTATTIDGESVNLQQDYLDQGKYVLIDFSCCWCGPCYQLHLSGLLDQVNNLDGWASLWIECDPDCGEAEIRGTSMAYSNQGCWTSINGVPVTYPIIDAAGVPAQFAAQQDGYVPLLMIVTPEGYYLNIRGYFSASQVAQSIQAIQAVAATAPQLGMPPACIIGGKEKAMANNPATFQALYNSADPITGVSWTATGATPATGTGETFTCTWTEPGTYTVSLEVTNQNGTDNDEMQVTVIQLADGLLTYTLDEEVTNSISLQSGTTTWGVMFPSSMLSGLNSINHVDLWCGYAGSYTMNIYTGGSDAPETLVGTVTKNCSAAEDYVSFTPTSAININPSKNLWVTFTSSVQYCATCCDYVGDANSDWIEYQGGWYHASTDLGAEYSWLINAYCNSGDPQGITTLSNAQVALYPNPTTNIVNVKAEGLQQVEVLDVNGRVVMTVNANTVDMSSLSNGMYMFRILTNNGVSMQKVVKK